MKYFCAAVFFMVSLLHLNAQDCNSVLSGVIVDFHDGKPLMNATIKVIGTDKVTFSDFDGKFKIPSLCDGNYELEITHPECKSLIYPVTIDGDTFKQIKLIKL